MAEVKLTGKSMEQRIADRLRNSSDGTNPNVHAVHGTGPTRTHTNVHHSGTAHGANRLGRNDDGKAGGGR